MAQLVKTEQYIHYFNIRAEESTDERFSAQHLRAVDRPLRARLPGAAIGNRTDSGFLNKLLAQVSAAVKQSGEPCIIVVDALDEADSLGTPTGKNILYFPVSLPERDLFVATARRDSLNLRTDAPLKFFPIAHDDQRNAHDVRQFVELQHSRPKILAYISHWQIESERFVDLLVGKSEGNFMYLHYVLPEIERGAYQTLALEAIPAGLDNYYEDHWQRMKNRNPDAWFDYKLPVLVALTAALSSGLHRLDPRLLTC